MMVKNDNEENTLMASVDRLNLMLSRSPLADLEELVNQPIDADDVKHMIEVEMNYLSTFEEPFYSDNIKFIDFISEMDEDLMSDSDIKTILENLYILDIDPHRLLSKNDAMSKFLRVDYIDEEYSHVFQLPMNYFTLLNKPLKELIQQELNGVDLPLESKMILSNLNHFVSCRIESVNLLRDDDYYGYINSLPTQYRLIHLQRYWSEIYDYPDVAVSTFVLAYKRSEYGFGDIQIWSDIVELMKKVSPDSPYLPSNSLRELANERGQVDIYRGESSKSVKSADNPDKYLSWTYDHKVADFFQNRFSIQDLDTSECNLIGRRVHIDDILLYIGGEEKEVIYKSSSDLK